MWLARCRRPLLPSPPPLPRCLAARAPLCAPAAPLPRWHRGPRRRWPAPARGLATVGGAPPGEEAAPPKPRARETWGVLQMLHREERLDSLPYDRYQEKCEEKLGMDAAEAARALEALHRQGHVAHFKGCAHSPLATLHPSPAAPGADGAAGWQDAGGIDGLPAARDDDAAAGGGGRAGGALGHAEHGRPAHRALGRRRPADQPLSVRATASRHTTKRCAKHLRGLVVRTHALTRAALGDSGAPYHRRCGHPLPPPRPKPHSLKDRSLNRLVSFAQG